MIKLSNLLETIPNNKEQESVVLAHEIGLEIRDILRTLIFEPETQKNVDFICTAIEKILSQLPENELAIEEFIHVMGARVLDGFQTTIEIKDEILELIYGYDNDLKELNDMIAQINQLKEKISQESPFF